MTNVRKEPTDDEVPAEAGASGTSDPEVEEADFVRTPTLDPEEAEIESALVNEALTEFIHAEEIPKTPEEVVFPRTSTSGAVSTSRKSWRPGSARPR